MIFIFILHLETLEKKLVLKMLRSSSRTVHHHHANGEFSDVLGEIDILVWYQSLG
jgi:hypothetical protein